MGVFGDIRRKRSYGLSVTADGDLSGIFGKCVGAVIQNFSVYGNITASSSLTAAGTVGAADDTVISGVISGVNISCAEGILLHRVGGILGYTDNAGFGGLTYCVNSGKINASGSYYGAIIGFAKDHDYSMSVHDNYYLDTSCGRAFGAGSSAAPGTALAKTQADFENGTIDKLIGSGSAGFGSVMNPGKPTGYNANDSSNPYQMPRTTASFSPSITSFTFTIPMTIKDFSISTTDTTPAKSRLRISIIGAAE